MDEEQLLGNSSDDEHTIQETPQRDSLETFSKHLVNRFGIIGHHNVSSETVNPPDNQKLYDHSCIARGGAGRLRPTNIQLK